MKRLSLLVQTVTSLNMNHVFNFNTISANFKQIIITY